MKAYSQTPGIGRIDLQDGRGAQPQEPASDATRGPAARIYATQGSTLSYQNPEAIASGFCIGQARW